jgi:hypothetical protein
VARDYSPIDLTVGVKVSLKAKVNFLLEIFL